MINKVASSEIFDLYAKRMISKRAAIPSPTVAVDLVSEAISAIRGIKEVIPMIGTSSTAGRTFGEAIKTISRATPEEAKVIFETLNKAGSSATSSESILNTARTAGYTGSYDDVIKDFSKEFAEMANDMSRLDAAATEPQLIEFATKHEKPLEFYRFLNDRAGIKMLADAKSEIKAAEAAKSTRPAEAGEADEAAKSNRPAKADSEEEAFARREAEKNADSKRRIKELNLQGKIRGGGFVAATTGLSTIALLAGGAWFYSKVREKGMVGAVAEVAGIGKGGNQLADLKVASEAVDCLNNINVKPGTKTALAKIEVLDNLDKFLTYKKLMDSEGEEGTENDILEANKAAAILVSGKEEKGSISNFLHLLDIDGDFEGGWSWGGSAIASMVYSGEITCLKRAIDNINSFFKKLNDARASDPDIQPDAGASAAGTEGTGAASGGIIMISNALSEMSKRNIGGGFQGIELANESKIISKMVNEAGSLENLAKNILNRGSYNIKECIKNGDKSNLIKEIYKQIKLMKEEKMNKSSKSTNNQQLIRNAAETKVSYFEDAKLGLKDQLTKSYYAGLTGMYNEKPQKRASDYKDLYGTQKETGEDLMVQSHPKSVTLAESMGKGGLVENNLEQQQKSIYVATTTPSGNFQSKYAQTINYLEKLSKAADNQGKKEVSRIINQTIKHLK